MADLLRTTITLPEDLLKIAKITSVKEGKTLSELVRESLEKRIKTTSYSKKELFSLAGTIDSDSPMFRDPRKYIEKLRQESDESKDFSH